MRACRVCGAHLNDDQLHWHETPGWKPDYDDFEGALKGYETVGADRSAIAALNEQR